MQMAYQTALNQAELAILFSHRNTSIAVLHLWRESSEPRPPKKCSKAAHLTGTRLLPSQEHVSLCHRTLILPKRRLVEGAEFAAVEFGPLCAKLAAGFDADQHMFGDGAFIKAVGLAG